jgi:gluconolactonase
MARSRPFILFTLIASVPFGCGEDTRTRSFADEPDGTGGGGAQAPEPTTGGSSDGGTFVSTGGATGGDPAPETTGGASGGTPPSGGMGGMGGAVDPGPVEPPIVPCDPLTELPPVSACPEGPFPADPLIEEEAEVVLCTKSTNVEWAEGPIWNANEGTLLFSNFDEADPAGLFNGSLMQYREGEGCSEVLSHTGTNGLAWGPAGTLITGRQTNRTLSRLDLETGTFCTLADTFEEKRFSSPNDVAVRSDGNMYFTDPAWNLGDRVEELPQSLYRIAPSGEISLISAYDNLRPNGVSLSPDETRLYVAIDGAILLFDVDAAGALSGERNFVTGTSVDGMAIDCAGNVYASTGHVYSPEGTLLGEFWGGTNLAFGGADRQTLYITGHRRLTSLRVAIPGMSY